MKHTVVREPSIGQTDTALAMHSESARPWLRTVRPDARLRLVCLPFAQALTVPLHHYEVVTIVGDSSQRMWDLEPAQRVLGYEPQYYLDDLGYTFAPPFDVEER